MRIHILGDWFEDEDRDALARALEARPQPRPPASELSWTGGPELPADAADVRLLVAGRPTADELDACSALEAVIVPWAGVPTALRTLLLARRHLRLHNLHHNAAPTAEMAVTLLLAAARRLVPCDRALRAGDWRPRYDEEPSLTLAGRSAAVLGYGAIGRRVARVLAAMDMQVHAIRRTPDDGADAPAGDDAGIRVRVAPDAEAIRAAVAGCHALVICLPLTPATTGLVDGPLLDALARPSLVVNVGRGDIVDEDALYERLADGRVFGAGLDTWWCYPPEQAARADTPPSTRPYDALHSVVLSPHRGGSERPEDERRRRMGALADLLLALAAGDEGVNRVDLDAGY